MALWVDRTMSLIRTTIKLVNEGPRILGIFWNQFQLWARSSAFFLAIHLSNQVNKIYRAKWTSYLQTYIYWYCQATLLVKSVISWWNMMGRSCLIAALSSTLDLWGFLKTSNEPSIVEPRDLFQEDGFKMMALGDVEADDSIYFSMQVVFNPWTHNINKVLQVFLR